MIDYLILFLILVALSDSGREMAAAMLLVLIVAVFNYITGRAKH